jgi:RimJ/RimL family protein N-acetyltransferase
MTEMRSRPDLVGEHNWAGPVDPSVGRERLLSTLRGDPLDQVEGLRVVELNDGTPIGDMSWRTERWGPSSRSACPAFGIALLPTFRGIGLGTEAQMRMVDFLFTAFDVHRVQTDTASDNLAEQRSLEKAGLRREGVVREAEYRNGRYYDHILFSILRHEWDETKRAFDAAVM